MYRYPVPALLRQSKRAFHSRFGQSAACYLFHQSRSLTLLMYCQSFLRFKALYLLLTVQRFTVQSYTIIRVSLKHLIANALMWNVNECTRTCISCKLTLFSKNEIALLVIKRYGIISFNLVMKDAQYIYISTCILH